VFTKTLEEITVQKLLQASVVVLMLAVCSIPALAEATVDVAWEMRNSENKLTTEAELDLNEYFCIEFGISASGQMESEDQFSTHVEKVGVDYQYKDLTVFAGLLSHNVGRARLNQVFVGDSSPAFPSIGYALRGKNWTYTKILGDLKANTRIVESADDIEDYKRVGIQYFNWRPFPNLSIGIGEALVTDRPFPGDIYYNAVPFLPYYFAKYFPGISSRGDNSLVYGDGELRLPLGTLYGELLVNEFPMVPNATNPKLFAITLGAESDSLLEGWNILAEYSYVSDRAYSNGVADAVYSYGDLSLGHPLGDDIQAVDLQVKRYWDQIDTETSFGLFYQRLGDTAVKPWSTEESVVAEQVYGVKLGGTRPFGQAQVGLDVEVGRVSNFRHEADRTGYRTSAVLKVIWEL